MLFIRMSQIIAVFIIGLSPALADPQTNAGKASPESANCAAITNSLTHGDYILEEAAKEFLIAVKIEIAILDSQLPRDSTEVSNVKSRSRKAIMTIVEIATRQSALSNESLAENCISQEEHDKRLQRYDYMIKKATANLR